MAGPVFHLKTPCPTVLLRHEVPGGSSHFDWMLAREGEGRERLVTFRMTRRVDELAPGGTLECEHIGDHRPEYLTYEGPLSGGRGQVQRVAGGVITDFGEHEDGYLIEVRWPAQRRQRVKLRRPVGSEPWQIIAGEVGGGDSPPGRLGSRSQAQGDHHAERAESS